MAARRMEIRLGGQIPFKMRLTGSTRIIWGQIMDIGSTIYLIMMFEGIEWKFCLGWSLYFRREV